MVTLKYRTHGSSFEAWDSPTSISASTDVKESLILTIVGTERNSHYISCDTTNLSLKRLDRNKHKQCYNHSIKTTDFQTEKWIKICIYLWNKHVWMILTDMETYVYYIFFVCVCVWGFSVDVLVVFCFCQYLNMSIIIYHMQRLTTEPNANISTIKAVCVPKLTGTKPYCKVNREDSDTIRNSESFHQCLIW